MTARTRLPLVVLLASLALTFAAAAIVGITGHARDEARFERAVASTEGRIRARLESYVIVLHGAKAMFAASDAVTEDDFHNFVLGFDLSRRYPGVQGVGFAAYVRAAAVDSLERARRADGDTAFHVRPRGALPIARGLRPANPLGG